MIVRVFLDSLRLLQVFQGGTKSPITRPPELKGLALRVLDRIVREAQELVGLRETHSHLINEVLLEGHWCSGHPTSKDVVRLHRKADRAAKKASNTGKSFLRIDDVNQWEVVGVCSGSACNDMVDIFDDTRKALVRERDYDNEEDKYMSEQEKGEKEEEEEDEEGDVEGKDVRKEEQDLADEFKKNNVDQDYNMESDSDKNLSMKSKTAAGKVVGKVERSSKLEQYWQECCQRVVAKFKKKWRATRERRGGPSNKKS